jgi:hypothetical protein
LQIERENEKGIKATPIILFKYYQERFFNALSVAIQDTPFNGGMR